MDIGAVKGDWEQYHQYYRHCDDEGDVTAIGYYGYKGKGKSKGKGKKWEQCLPQLWQPRAFRTGMPICPQRKGKGGKGKRKRRISIRMLQLRRVWTPRPGVSSTG
jgi:hypothetical protein